jgi:hypothetical protein
VRDCGGKTGQDGRRYANLSLREMGLERARMGGLVRADVSG